MESPSSSNNTSPELMLPTSSVSESMPSTSSASNYLNITDQEPGDFFYTGIFAKMPSVLEDDDYKKFIKKEAKLITEELKKIINESNIESEEISRRVGLNSDESMNFDWDSLGPDFFLSSVSEVDTEENAASKCSLEKAGVANLSEEQDEGDTKNLEGKPNKEVPSKISKQIECITIEDDYTPFDVGVKNCKAKDKNATSKCSLEKGYNRGEQDEGDTKNLKRKPMQEVPAKTAKRRKCININNEAEASDVGVKKRKAKDKKATSDKKINPGPLTSTVTSQSSKKSENKLATDSQNIGDPIRCSILLNLLKSPPLKLSSPSGEEKFETERRDPKLPPPKVSSPSGEVKSETESSNPKLPPPKVSSPSGEEKSSSFAGFDPGKKLPRDGGKANGAKNMKDAAITKVVKLLPDERVIDDRVLRIFINKANVPKQSNNEVKLLPDEKIIGNRVLRVYLNRG